jgi:hypothetical protein
MRWRSRRLIWGTSEQCAQLVLETEKFLSGHIDTVGAFSSTARPAWVEFNWIAHAPADDVLASVRASDSSPIESSMWAAIVHLLAVELHDLSGGDVGVAATLQRECLLPLELDLLAHPAQGVSPREVFVRGLTSLRGHPRVTRADRP